MPTASKILGKAFLGNTKALKDLGIAYKPTGDKAKDMAAIMGLVNDKVGGFAEKQGKTAAGTADILANQFGEVQEQIGSYLVPALTTLGQWLIRYIIPAVQTLVGWLSEHLAPAFSFISEAWGVFTEALSGGEVTTQGVMGTIGQFAYFITDTVIPAVQNLAAGFMENVWPAIQTVVGIIAENLQPVVTALAEYWTGTLWPAIQRLIPVFATVAKVIGIVVGALAVAISWIIGKVVPIFLNILSPAIGFVVTVFEKVAGAIEWVIENFGGFIAFAKSIPDKVKSAFSTLVNIITWPFRTAFNGIANMWNSTVGNLSFSVPDWVPGIGGDGFSMPHIPTIPALAKGGIVTRPTLALIGEAGPEAVIPLGRGGPGPQVVVNITSPLGTPEQIARAVQSAVRKGRGSGGLAGAF